MRLTLDSVRLPLADFELAVTLDLAASVTGIVGPSGAGKTSLLDLIVGLRHPIAGTVTLDGQPLDDVTRRVHVPPRERGMGYVPQDNALFPHLSVEGNIRYGTEARLQPEVIEVLDIGRLLKRKVTSLSGGEQKRVALARALATEPRLLLLDEPLSGIDRPLQSRIIGYLEQLRVHFQVPMIYVTHDGEGLSRMAEQVITLERGRIVPQS